MLTYQHRLLLTNIFNSMELMVPVTHEVDGAVTGHLIPDANVTYDLGSPTLAFRDLYLSSSSIHLAVSNFQQTPQQDLS